MQPLPKFLYTDPADSRPKYTNIDLALIQFRWRPAWTKSFSVVPQALATRGSNAASFARGTDTAIRDHPEPAPRVLGQIFIAQKSLIPDKSTTHAWHRIRTYKYFFGRISSLSG